LVYALAPDTAIFRRSRHGTVPAGQAARRVDTRGALASRRLCNHRRRVADSAKLGRPHRLARAAGGDEGGASIAEHYRTSRPAARSRCGGQHPKHPHQRAHAMAGLADAVSHRAPRLSGSAVSSAERIARGDFHRAWRGAADDDVPGIPDRGIACIPEGQDRIRLFRDRAWIADPPHG